MNILFLTTVLPGGRTMGSEVASQALIDAMRERGHAVTVLGYVRSGGRHLPAAGETAIAARAIETSSAGLAPLFWFAGGVLAGLPYSAAKYRSAVYVNAVRAHLERQRYDVAVVDHAQLTWLLDVLPAGLPKIAMMHNVEHEMYKAFADEPMRSAHSRLAYRREARLVERLERRLAAAVGEVWVLTESDARFFASVAGAQRVRVIALPGGSSATVPRIPKAFDVALIGSWSWQPNRDALEWFLERILPRLPASMIVEVAGKGADWLAGKHPNVIYRGFVDDSQAFLAGARVVAIPTQSGGGIQIKTLDAISSGSRIVATPVSMRGIALPPETVVVAEEAERFADLLVSAVSMGQDATLPARIEEWGMGRRKAFGQAVAAGLDNVARSRREAATAALA